MWKKGLVELKNKFHTLSFKDTVLSLRSANFTRKSSSHCGKIYWIVKCQNQDFKILDDHLVDKSFLQLVENKSMIGKTYIFSTTVKGKYLLTAEEVSA